MDRDIGAAFAMATSDLMPKLLLPLGPFSDVCMVREEFSNIPLEFLSSLNSVEWKFIKSLFLPVTALNYASFILHFLSLNTIWDRSHKFPVTSSH